MSDIAIDIVLLPDPQVRDCALRINDYLVKHCQSSIQLDPHTCLPHVSLAMGCLNKDDLGRLVSELEPVVEASEINTFQITGINVHSHGDRVVSHLAIERTPEIRALHEAIMQQSTPYLHAEPKTSMFHAPPIAESTFAWVRSYSQKAAFENFDPHITLGYGDPGEQDLVKKMVPEYVAIFQLGNHCTCRKILAKVKIP